MNMAQPSRGKLWLFYAIALSPLIAVVAALAYFALWTDTFPRAYLFYIRNINFDCFEIVDQPYVYRMKPGECRFDNAEYRTVQTIDSHGFRNAHPAVSYDARIVLLGDSHVYGFSVNDADTLNAQLKTRHGIDALNLGIPTFATARELEAARLHAPKAEVVVLQYCENDFGENAEYLSFPPEQEPEVRKGVLQNITEAKEVYTIRKATSQPWHDTLSAIAQVVRQREYATRPELQARAAARDYPQEALKFSGILARYKDYLRGRHVIVYESTSYGRNSPRFAKTFDAVLRKQLPDLDVEVLDVSQYVNQDDYFWLDDHPRASFYAKVADMLGPRLGAAH